MSWRFQRHIRLGPFLRLNLGKAGVSTSVGIRGAHVTFGHNQVRTTVGLPGSGLFLTHSSNLGHVTANVPPAVHVCQLPECDPRAEAVGRAVGWVLILGIAVLVALGLLLLTAL
jgi:Protein of unknown function (DUF4236)